MWAGGIHLTVRWRSLPPQQHQAMGMEMGDCWEQRLAHGPQHPSSRVPSVHETSSRNLGSKHHSQVRKGESEYPDAFHPSKLYYTSSITDSKAPQATLVPCPCM